MESLSSKQKLAQLFVLCLLSGAQSAFAVAGVGSAGATTITTVIAWLGAIGVGVCTIAIMWGAFRIMFQGARINDVAPIFIGGILFGSAGTIALLVTAG